MVLPSPETFLIKNEKFKEMKERRMVEKISPKAGFLGIVADKTGRNDLCPCGSGKKAKKCCGCETKYYNRNKTS